MGIHVGFDLFPPLETAEKEQWCLFLLKVAEKYESDPVLHLAPDRIEFKVGEHPTLDFSTAKFRRFSSKVSGSGGKEKAEPYIMQVGSIAREFFGSRIRFWDTYGYSEVLPPYCWGEVHTAAEGDTPEEDIFLGWAPDSKPTFVMFSDVCLKALSSFEMSNVGMCGLAFKSATFPTGNAAFHITQR